MSLLRALDHGQWDRALWYLEIYLQDHKISKEVYDKMKEYIECQKKDIDQD